MGKVEWQGIGTLIAATIINMNGQEPSPAALSAQRAVADHKQTTSIRKITIESISPVLTQLQHHIAYLLQETATLRAQNAHLVATAATQQQLEAQVSTLGQQLEQLSGRVSSGEREQLSLAQESAGERERGKVEVAGVRKEVGGLAQRLQEMGKENSHYLELIDSGRQEQLDGIEQLKRSIENYYEQEIIRVDAVADQAQALALAQTALEQRRQTDCEEVAKLGRVTALYEAQREEYRRLLERTSGLEASCVRTEDYEKDKKYQRIAGELLRKDIQDMLERALTPEIRRFLPQLIAKLASLEAFQTQLAALQTRTLSHEQQQREAVELLGQQWEHRHSQLTDQLESSKTTHELQLEQEIDRIDRKLNLQQAIATERQRELEKTGSAAEAEWGRQLQLGLRGLEEELKGYLKGWGDNFIASKKEEIYSAVQTLKPPTEVQENKKLAETVNEMEPLIRQVRSELQLARTEMEAARGGLADKLSHFNNQIVKMKTDLGKESGEVRKCLERFQVRLQEGQRVGEQLSRLGAVLTETAIMQLALSMDPRFLRLPHEVYVTYNDGILCELHHESNLLTYRRKSLQPELLKRAAMSQFVLLVDKIIQEQPLLGWQTPSAKPSHFFAQTLAAYNTLREEHSESLDQKTQANSTSLGKRHLESPQQVPLKDRTSSLRRRFPKGEVLSQTLDIGSEGRATARYAKDEQQPNYRQVRLRKIERKEGEQ